MKILIALLAVVAMMAEASAQKGGGRSTTFFDH
jgi:hypothetical protein